jgi:RNA polymerase sigma factor (sigma-70 family)
VEEAIRSLTDEQLLLALRDAPPGDPAGLWQEWQRLHLQTALAVAVHTLRKGALTADLPEDVLQQGALKFLLHLKGEGPVRPSLSYYLTIVRNLAVDAVREEARRRRALYRFRQARGSVQSADDVTSREQVAEVLGLLSAECREILEAHYLSFKSAGEIAAERGVTVGHVYRVLHRGRSQVRHWASCGRPPRSNAA